MVSASTGQMPGPKLACVKVELRESVDTKQKRKTPMRKADENGVWAFIDVFDFSVTDDLAGELRVQLFGKSDTSVMNSKAVVANAGIYVKNIVGHVVTHGEIDKTFKLFTKDGATTGGEVRLRVAFTASATKHSVDTKDSVGAGVESNAPAVSVETSEEGSIGDETTIETETNETESAQSAPAAKETRKHGESSGDEKERKAPGASEKAQGGVSPLHKAVACGVFAIGAFVLFTLARGGRKYQKVSGRK